MPGTAVFLTSDSDGAPPVLLHHLKHNQVLHEKVMLMSVVTEEIPHVDAMSGWSAELGEGFYQVVAHYGFMETPDVPGVLRRLARGDADGKAVAGEAAETTFYLGRETLIVGREATADRATTAGGGPSPPVIDGAWRRSCSSSWPGTPSRPPPSSVSRPIAWWSWERRSSSDGATALGGPA